VIDRHDPVGFGEHPGVRVGDDGVGGVAAPQIADRGHRVGGRDALIGPRPRVAGGGRMVGGGDREPGASPGGVIDPGHPSGQVVRMIAPGGGRDHQSDPVGVGREGDGGDARVEAGLDPGAGRRLLEQVGAQDHRVRRRIQAAAQQGDAVPRPVRAEDLRQQWPGECDQHDRWTGDRWFGHAFENRPDHREETGKRAT